MAQSPPWPAAATMASPARGPLPARPSRRRIQLRSSDRLLQHFEIEEFMEARPHVPLLGCVANAVLDMPPHDRGNANFFSRTFLIGLERLSGMDDIAVGRRAHRHRDHGGFRQ